MIRGVRDDNVTGCIWITGASTGIGYALALKCASEGRVVAASARTLPTLKSYKEQEVT